MSKLVTLLKAIGIMIAFVIALMVIGIIIHSNYYLHVFFIACAIIAGVYWLYRQMRPKKRYYFVSYTYGRGFGDCYIDVTGLFIRNDVEQFINNKLFNGAGSMVILYYKELSKKRVLRSGERRC